ncbi:MAG: VWA domain-containing protein [Bacteroidetes bacterium]|nr:VWA domain-containing protein [Bacteroidota bacterium]MBL0063583.1 VWA domain-containing protein [Bacteroidota bacterium]MBL0139989.1 VWA domain-containing protein [Bacteroidota bacterium]
MSGLQNRKVISAFLILLLGIPFFALAQDHVKGMKVKRMPKDYLEPTGKLVPENAKTAEGEYSYWRVYSDRDNNQTYKDPYLKTPFKTLQFMDAFFVIQERWNAVRIARYDGTLGDKYTIQHDSLDYGWIEKSRLLLWKKCLIDTVKTNFNLKGLVIRNYKVFENLEELKRISQEKFPLYASPALKTRTQNDINLFDFLFIYKYENGAYLIGKREDISVISAKTDVLGWVPEVNLRPWGQRLCLEPNSKTEAVTERKAAGVQAGLFESEEKARKYQNGEKVNPLKYQDPYEKGMQLSEKRFPVIADQKNGILKTGFITDVLDKNGKAIITTDQQADIEKKYNQARDDYRVINVVFVIDGSEKVQPYMQSVISSIQNSMSLLKSDSRNKFNYGAVVYRNYSCENEQIVSLQDLSSNISTVTNFLQKQTSTALPCSKVKSDGTAMYYGISKAVKLFRKKEQNNIVMVIGSGGNYLVDKYNFDETNVSTALADMQCSLVSFQVQYNGEDEQRFVSQSKELIKQSAKKIRDRLDDVKLTKVSKVTGIKFESTDKRLQNEFSLVFPGGDSPVPGKLTAASPNRPNSPSYIQEQIEDIITNRNQDNEMILSKWDAKVKGIGATAIKMDEELYLLLKNSKIDPSAFQKLDVNTNFQIFVEAYASVKQNKLKKQLFNFVLFMDDDDLYDLIIQFRKLGNATTEQELRKNLVDSYKQLAISYYGSRESKSAINKKSLAEIMGLITGLPSRSELFTKYTISDLESSRTVTVQILKDIAGEINDIKTDLERIRSRHSYSFTSYDQTYYWIPAEALH